ncbi:MAG: hypothetical protein ACKVPX_18025 [Myxococcaceae bacterium]
MVTASLLTALVLSQGSGVLDRQTVGPISFEVPPGWRRTFRFGTVRFDDSAGGGYALVDSSQVLASGGLSPEECRDKIVVNLGGPEGWVGLTAGGLPAGSRAYVESSADMANTVVTSRWVGCDGVNTWSILFEIESRHYRRIQPFILNWIASLRYEAAPGSEKSPPPPALPPSPEAKPSAPPPKAPKGR